VVVSVVAALPAPRRSLSAQLGGSGLPMPGTVRSRAGTAVARTSNGP
jgi:hypothetical protein